MRISILLIFISFFISKQTKANDITIELAVDSAIQEIDFSCLKVIDARFNKDNLGLITRGLKKNDSKIILPNEFSVYIKQTLDNLLAKDLNKPELVIIFRDIIISENIGTMNQYGYCNVEIEFARQENSLLYSLGTFNSCISENNNKVKYSHGNRLLQTLEDCFRKFNKTNWNSDKGILLGDLEKGIDFDYKTIPNKGIYLNFDQLTRNSPLTDLDFVINEAKETNKFISYNIDFKENINPELVQFVSDGTDVYMHAYSNQYLKSITYGKYIYFRGKFPSSSNTDQTIFLVGMGAGLAGGLVGGLFFSLVADVSNANNSIKGVVINTGDGTLKVVTDYYIHEITKDYPDLFKEYRSSKRKLEDKETTLIKLNSKF